MYNEKAILINAMLDVEEKLRLCNEIISELVAENQKLRDECALRESIIVKLYEELKDIL